MKHSLNLVLLFGYILLANVSQAQMPPAALNQHQHHPHSPALVPNSIEGNNQYYDGSPDGLREYLEDVKEAKPKVYIELDGQVSALETQDSLVKWSSYGAIGIGAAVSIGAFTFLQTTKSFEGIEIRETNHAALYGGMGLVFGGFMANWLLRPDRKDMMKVINKHNKINKEAPLKWQLGFNLLPSGSSLAFAAAF